jgi:Zn-dependent metalloprotease
MTKLVYWDQSGSLFDSLAVVFATLIKQYALRQSANQADWTLGTGLFMADVRARGLVSLALPAPRTTIRVSARSPAFAHARLCQDDPGQRRSRQQRNPEPRVLHCRRFLGGYAWDTVGRVWYEAIRRGPLPKNAQFADFARITVAQARALFGKNGAEAEAVSDAWRRVGVVPRSAAQARARKR